MQNKNVDIIVLFTLKVASCKCTFSSSSSFLIRLSPSFVLVSAFFGCVQVRWRKEDSVFVELGKINNKRNVKRNSLISTLPCVRKRPV